MYVYLDNVCSRAQMFVEDAVSAKGPIAVEVNPLSTVAELKLQVTGLGKRSFQKNATFLHSFAFFIKEHFVLCVLFRSL